MNQPAVTPRIIAAGIPQPSPILALMFSPPEDDTGTAVEEESAVNLAGENSVFDGVTGGVLEALKPVDVFGGVLSALELVGIVVLVADVSVDMDVDVLVVELDVLELILSVVGATDSDFGAGCSPALAVMLKNREFDDPPVAPSVNIVKKNIGDTERSFEVCTVHSNDSALESTSAVEGISIEKFHLKNWTFERTSKVFKRL